MEGRQISHYKILHKIGAGGMGEVYLAQDTVLERNVALKILPSDVVANEDRMRRFVQEAKTASSLKHSNIVPIYEIGDSDGTRFIAMEYIEGETLEAKLKGQSLDTAQILDYGTQMADALDEAHSKGIIHRDIKSSNIMITSRGQVKILDFGLAKVTTLPETPGVSELNTKTGTEPGIVLGTVQYMSPEQALGKSTDARSDIFSLGIVLYQMTTGTLPFSGQTPSETMNRIINAAPEAIARFNYNVPPDLERIIRRCLEKDPDRRYQSARDLLIDLKNLKRDTDSAGYSQAVATSKKPRSFKTTAIALIAIVAALGFYFWMMRRPAIHSIAVLPFINATGDPKTEYLSDGITESTINTLSQLPNVKVMARSTVFRFKGKQQDPQQIGDNLKVDAVLTGTMDQQQNRLLINTELVKVSDGSQLWGQQFSRNLSDLLAVQNEISSQIAEQLKVRLSGEQKKQLIKQSTDNSEAYRLYLQGRYQWNKRSKEGYLKAIEYFNEAIEKDPTYALAYTGLAEAYVTDTSPFPLDVKLARGKAAALKALQFNPNLAEAHNSLAAAYSIEWNWEAAGKEFRKAIALNPNYPTAHQWYGEYLIPYGKFDEARAELKRARELDPLSLIIMATSGFLEFFAHDYPKAEEYSRRTLEMDNHFPLALIGIRQSMLIQKKYKELFDFADQLDLDDQTRKDVEEAKKAYESGGERAFFELQLKWFLTRGASSYEVAEAYAQLGNKDKAIEYLEKAFIQRDASNLRLMKYDPWLDGIRSDPRFQKLEQEVYSRHK